MDLIRFTQGPRTAAAAGLSDAERRRARETGLIRPVMKNGKPVIAPTRRGRGRPPYLYRLTPKGRRALIAANTTP